MYRLSLSSKSDTVKMEVEVRSTEILKAETTDPNPYKLRLSDIDNSTVKVYLLASYFYRNPANENCEFMPERLLKRGLSRTLCHFYELAGRLVVKPGGNLEVDCNNAGVQWVDQTAEFH